MKRIIITIVAIMMATSPMALAQPKGGRPGPGKPDAEKKDAAEDSEEAAPADNKE